MPSPGVLTKIKKRCIILGQSCGIINLQLLLILKKEMGVNMADQGKLNESSVQQSDYAKNASFQAAVKEFGTERATEAYKKAEEIALAELAKTEVQVTDGKENDSEDGVIPDGFGSKSPEVIKSLLSDKQADPSALVQDRIFELMTLILTNNLELDTKKHPDQPFLLTEMLNGNSKVLDEYLRASKN